MAVRMLSFRVMATAVLWSILNVSCSIPFSSLSQRVTPSLLRSPYYALLTQRGLPNARRVPRVLHVRREGPFVSNPRPPCESPPRNLDRRARRPPGRQPWPPRASLRQPHESA